VKFGVRNVPYVDEFMNIGKFVLSSGGKLHVQWHLLVRQFRFPHCSVRPSLWRAATQL